MTPAINTLQLTIHAMRLLLRLRLLPERHTRVQTITTLGKNAILFRLFLSITRSLIPTYK